MKIDEAEDKINVNEKENKKTIKNEEKNKEETKDKEIKLLNKKRKTDEEIEEQNIKNMNVNILNQIKDTIEKEMVNSILQYLKNGVNLNVGPNSYMNSYSIIQKNSELNNQISDCIIEYHNKVIQDFIDYCYLNYEKESKINIIDSFINFTEKINIFIYWMNRIFIYLDRKNLRKNKYPHNLAFYALNLYKNHFFDKIQDNIYREVNKFIKEDRMHNFEYMNKIIIIFKIINYLDFNNPMIIKENNTIKWINQNTIIKKRKYLANWFNNYFKKETIIFAKDKAKHDINNMSAPEYISEQLKYLNEENIRKNEYINENYHEKINNINYQYLIGDIAEELAQKDTGISYMFDNKQDEEIKKAYELINLYPDKLDEKYIELNNENNENKNRTLFINKATQVITSSFYSYIIKRGDEIFKNKEISKNPRTFIPELISLNKEMNNILLNCFSNNIIYQEIKFKSFNKFMEKNYYSKQLSNYIDFCMRDGFKGKTYEEINNILDDVIQLFKCLTSKTLFRLESDNKLSDRLLKNTSLSINNEKIFISKLKQEQGLNFVNQKNKMIEDLEQNIKDIDEYKRSNSKGLPNGIKFNVKVVTQGAWSINKNDIVKIKIPKILNSCMNDFETFYLKRNEGRKLIWCLGLSTVEIKYLCFQKQNISVSTLPQFLTLLILEKYNSLSIQKISELLECDIKILLKDIPGLVYNPIFNPKGERNKGLILGTFDGEKKEFKPGDEIQFNKEFFFQRQRFKTLSLTIKKSEEEIKKEDEEDDKILKKRHELIVQGNIARIMKSRIKCTTTHSWLVSEVVKQIEEFRPQPHQIKENIEKLIEKNIIKRSDDRGCYEYVA